MSKYYVNVNLDMGVTLCINAGTEDDALSMAEQCIPALVEHTLLPSKCSIVKQWQSEPYVIEEVEMEVL